MRGYGNRPSNYRAARGARAVQSCLFKRGRSGLYVGDNDTGHVEDRSMLDVFSYAVWSDDVFACHGFRVT